VSVLFSPLTLRGATFRNRVWVSPMCQYSSVDGYPSEWHLVHLGSFARGGAGLVMAEATAVSPDGRISPEDAGLWSEELAASYEPIVRFIHSQGAAAGIQLAHAGRKGSTKRPSSGTGSVPISEGGWTTVAPSAIPYGDFASPAEMSTSDIANTVAAFVAATERADRAGFDVVEIHGAHGYLIHEFLSPLTNRRTDGYGGGFDGRVRILVETAEAVRQVWPDNKPLLVRLSATDWAEGGWDLAETVELSTRLKNLGVDLIDVSSGGNVPWQKIQLGPGYQVPFAAAVRDKAGIPTAAVGLIDQPGQAEEIVGTGRADAIFMARPWLRDPHLALRFAAALGDKIDYWPIQYERAKPMPEAR
jgi:2,4-dienoyl-CoA reductase-like NADH-dependent reductase (Old Yellow Enzyme family)